MKDAFGAFCEFQSAHIEGAPAGPLAGLSFGAKDTYDVAGHRTGNGSPAWLARAEPARETAPAIAQLVAAGATLVGKTHCDELCFSIEGENVHYGTPRNPAAPDRIPGGSSSGSAVAVAAGLVDFALGTDAGGSVRLPASFCGVLGIRVSHGRIAAEGVARLAPSIGSAGWFARRFDVLDRVGSVLLADRDACAFAPRRLVVARDMLELVDDRTNAALRPAIAALAGDEIELVEGEVWQGRRDGLFSDLRTIQGSEAWSIYGPWITAEKPELGAAIRARFDWASGIDPASVGPARQRRARFAAEFARMVGEDTLVAFPTAPGPAPRLASAAAVLDPYRVRALKLSALSGLTGTPQISLPLASVDGAPVGLSLVAPRGSDHALLGWLARRARSTGLAG